MMIFDIVEHYLFAATSVAWEETSQPSDGNFSGTNKRDVYMVGLMNQAHVKTMMI